MVSDQMSAPQTAPPSSRNNPPFSGIPEPGAGLCGTLRASVCNWSLVPLVVQ